jgi:hypothetical protein
MRAEREWPKQVPSLLVPTQASAAHSVLRVAVQQGTAAPTRVDGAGPSRIHSQRRRLLLRTIDTTSESSAASAAATHQVQYGRLCWLHRQQRPISNLRLALAWYASPEIVAIARYFRPA